MSAKNGIYADGKYYFSTSYEMVGELLYMYWYCYDAGTLTQLSSDYFSYPDKEDLMTSACTYDPVTKQGYAVSLDAGGIVFFNSVDLESGTLTPIATGMPVQLLAMAANSVGQLYGVGSDGKLYSVEKSTGGLTEIGATGVQPEGDQSMAFSMMDGALYWCAYRQDGTSGLYEIDLQTGAATLIGDMPENQRIVGLYVTDPDVLPGAPATVTDLEATFENGKHHYNYLTPYLTFSHKEHNNLDYEFSPFSNRKNQQKLFPLHNPPLIELNRHEHYHYSK